MKQTYFLATTYGEGDYGENYFGGCKTNSLTNACEPTSLVNTGTGIMLAVGLAAAIIFTAVLIRLLKKPKNPKDTQE